MFQQKEKEYIKRDNENATTTNKKNREENSVDGSDQTDICIVIWPSMLTLVAEKVEIAAKYKDSR